MARAAVMTAPGHMEVRSQPDPNVEPGGVVLSTVLSEVCGTDVHLYHGRLAGVPYPIIPGHVSVGRIMETGGAVTDVEGRPLLPGEIVTFLDVHGTCGACWYCQVAQATTRCPHRKVYGITMSADDGLFGGWSDTIYLKPGTRILPLDEAPPEAFMGGGCGLATALHAVERADIRFGDTVLVQGSGPVGLSALALAGLKGATRLLMTGGGADARRLAALALGADLFLDVFATTEAERLDAVRRVTGGRGADVVIEASGAPAAVPEGMRLARDAGAYIVVGQYTDNGAAAFNPHEDLNRKHLRVQGVWGVDYSHYHRALKVLQRHQGTIPWESFLSRTYSLDDMPLALDDVEHARVIKAAVRP
ncbi:MAG TPA: zinc-binding dehydrogenase [Armatimonadota bacterium]|jgi:L-iditol 2-dehydrogenase